MRLPIRGLAGLALVLSLPAAAASTEEEKRAFKSFDGFVLNGAITRPKGLKDEAAKRVVVIIHGSGPQTMDGDFTSATKGRKKNLMYKDVALALSKAGWVVIRYNKRGYELRKKIQADRAYLNSKEFAEAMKHPLGDIVGDALAMAKYGKQRFKQAQVYLLGHSQGTYVGLQVAHKNPFIKGVAMIGTMAASLATLSFEQIIYRSLIGCRKLDTNHDGKLSAKELAGDGKIANALKLQLPVLDTDKDNQISMDEIKAGNFSSFLAVLDAPAVRAMAKEEASLPSVRQILKKTAFKVAFFQGEWDNQTPAYQVRGIQLLNKFRWNNDKLRFWYFPKLGHALDPRERYEQVLYNPIDAKALAQLVTGMGEFFK